MKNLKDQFVSREIAIKLKEKGFNEPCISVYRNFNLYFDKMISGYESDVSESNDFSTNTSLDNFDVNKKDKSNYWITAPLLTQVIDWFREKHNLYIEIRADYNDYTFCINSKDHNNKRLKELRMNFGFKEYYETLNKAIEESLKLI